MGTLRGRLVLGAVMVAVGVALGGCGGSESDNAGSSSTGSTSTGTATGDATTAQATATPEDTIAPDAEVSAGLVKLKGVAAKVGAAADGDQAKKTSAGLEPVWRPIEGTVKKNEPDLYLDVEDSFQRLGSGDLANAKKGAEALNAAVDAYLAKHPG